MSSPPETSGHNVRFTYTNMLIECLRDGEARTITEIYTAIVQKYPYIHEKSLAWKNNVSQRLLHRYELFELISTPIVALFHWRMHKIAIEKTKNFIIQNADRYKYGNAAMLSKIPNIPSVDNHSDASAHRKKIRREPIYKNKLIGLLKEEDMTFPMLIKTFIKLYLNYKKTTTLKQDIKNTLLWSKSR